jgi:hypothetical protein
MHSSMASRALVRFSTVMPQIDAGMWSSSAHTCLRTKSHSLTCRPQARARASKRERASDEVARDAGCTVTSRTLPLRANQRRRVSERLEKGRTSGGAGRTLRSRAAKPAAGVEEEEKAAEVEEEALALPSSESMGWVLEAVEPGKALRGRRAS